MRHDSCDHPSTPSARAKCRKKTPGLVKEYTIIRHSDDFWSAPKIRQEASRAAAKYQSSNPLDVRSYAEIYQSFLQDFSEKHGK